MAGLLITSLIWAFSFGLTKKLCSIDANLVAFIRLGLALPLFIPFFRFKGLTLKLIVQLFLVGAIEYGIFYCLYVSSYHYLPSYLVALFMVLGPLYVTIISDIYIKQFRIFPFLMALLAVLGAAIIVYDPNNPIALSSELLIGFGLAQAAMLAFSFGQVAYKNIRRKNPKLNDINIFALLYAGSVVVTSCAASYTGSLSLKTLSAIQSDEWLILIYLGTIASGFCFFLWNKSAVKVSGGTLAVFNNLKIPLAILASLTVFGEEANIYKLAIGGSIIGAAIYLSERRDKKIKQS